MWCGQVVRNAGRTAVSAVAACCGPAGSTSRWVRWGGVARPRQASLAGAISRHTTCCLQLALLCDRVASPRRHVRQSSWRPHTLIYFDTMSLRSSLMSADDCNPALKTTLRQCLNYVDYSTIFALDLDKCCTWSLSFFYLNQNRKSPMKKWFINQIKVNGSKMI